VGLREIKKGGTGGLPLVEKFAKVGKMDRKYRHNDRIGCMIVIGKRLGRWG
jgi:hypothetical protein